MSLNMHGLIHNNRYILKVNHLCNLKYTDRKQLVTAEKHQLWIQISIMEDNANKIINVFHVDALMGTVKVKA